MKKVEDIKRPLKVGELFLVPCIVRTENDKLFITPVYNHPHNDIENGQSEIHYHADLRFIKHENNGDYPTIINKHSKHYFVEDLRPVIGLHGDLEYFVMPVVNEDFKAITNVNLISKTKLKHKCIHKGKCPHRGFDLSQVKDVNGIIKCPLHGLEFNKEGKLINN